MEWLPAIEQYVNACLAMNTLSQSSARTRALFLKEFSVFCTKNGFLGPHDVHKNIILGYFSQKKVSNNTKRTFFFTLHGFFKYLEDDRIIEDNPLDALTPPQEKKIESDFLNEEEIGLFFDSVITNSRSDVMDRNMLIAAILVGLCLRVSEICELKLSDVNFIQKTIRVRRKGGSESLLPISDELIVFFDRWVDARHALDIKNNDWFFLSSRGDRLSVRTIQHFCRISLFKGGLFKRRMGPHTLRHSGATNYLSKGVDIKTIQNLLGHSNLATTSRYVHSGREQITSALKKLKLSELLGKK